jgi:kynurenine formamidase
MPDLPKYDDLPLLSELKSRHAWGLWGEEDTVGRLNLLTPERLLAAKSEIQRGDTFNVTMPLNEPNPPWSTSREQFRHHVFAPNRNSQDDYLDNFYLQGSSQWDSLRHIKAREFGFYNGVDDSSDAKLGIANWAQRGIVGRGVLVDVAEFCAAHQRDWNARAGTRIDVDLITEVLAAQRVSVHEGDILMLRTGFVGEYLNADAAGRADFAVHKDSSGLIATEDMARYLWDTGWSAVVSDNPAVEAVPGSAEDGYLHRRLIPLLGFALGELFDFDTLAEDCRVDGRYSCFFIGVPLNLPGGVGSPANSIAIK